MSASNPFEALQATERGNVTPILHEVTHALERLLDNGEPTVIDLSSLPFAPGELEKLEERLGTGELTATLHALGESRIRETRYPGVWWLEHRNTDDEIVGRYIEITRMPQILMSQDADIQAGRAQLVDALGEHGTGNDNEETLT